MKHTFIAMVGNWVDRVDIILEHEGIDKNTISSMNIAWNPVHNATYFSIYSRG